MCSIAVIMRTPLRRPLMVVALLSAAMAGLMYTQLPAFGANGLLHPARRHVDRTSPETCAEITFNGAGVALKGWLCHTTAQRRGTLVYLHGIADNRTSGV